MKRLSADDSADSRVKVGHRQAFIPKSPSSLSWGIFLMLYEQNNLVGVSIDKVNAANRALGTARTQFTIERR